jgi:hypothetical protein
MISLFFYALHRTYNKKNILTMVAGANELAINLDLVTGISIKENSLTFMFYDHCNTINFGTHALAKEAFEKTLEKWRYNLG